MKPDERPAWTLTLGELRAELRAGLAELQAPTGAAPAYVDARTAAAQLGLTRSMFLDLCAAKAFPSFVLGRRRVARYEDVLAHVQRIETAQSTESGTPVSDERAEQPSARTHRRATAPLIGASSATASGDELAAALADGSLRLVKGGRP